jgi:hypothetical protein
VPDAQQATQRRTVSTGCAASALQVRNPMFQHSKGHCDVTRYAADYVALKGEHFFKSGTSSSKGKA